MAAKSGTRFHAEIAHRLIDRPASRHYHGLMGDTYIVAEIGTGHAGDLTRAEELIHAAKESGADCAKFQYIIAREIVHPNIGVIPLPGGDTPLYKRFKELELS